MTIERLMMLLLRQLHTLGFLATHAQTRPHHSRLGAGLPACLPDGLRGRSDRYIVEVGWG